MTKSDKNRMGMSQMKDKNSPHTKRHRNKVGVRRSRVCPVGEQISPKGGEEKTI